LLHVNDAGHPEFAVQGIAQSRKDGLKQLAPAIAKTTAQTNDRRASELPIVIFFWARSPSPGDRSFEPPCRRQASMPEPPTGFTLRLPFRVGASRTRADKSCDLGLFPGVQSLDRGVQRQD
jgi:hypothetical protein